MSLSSSAQDFLAQFVVPVRPLNLSELWVSIPKGKRESGDTPRRYPQGIPLRAAVPKNPAHSREEGILHGTSFHFLASSAGSTFAPDVTEHRFVGRISHRISSGGSSAAA